ncbi:tyrosine recombinase XerC [Comamonadaceae bacterium OS-4]|nr:tyrosine recombinase XerC [Comamonadaceae bacterium OS-4]
MHLYSPKSLSPKQYILFDDSERIAVLPTDFIRHLSGPPRNRADGTLALYAVRLRDFCAFLEGHPAYGQIRVDDAIRAVGFPAIDEFYRSCQAKGFGESTMRGYEVVVKSFTDWLVTESAGRAREHALYDNERYRTPAPSRRMARYLTLEQVTTLILGMHWESQRLITHFIYDTAVRVSEVPRVLKSDMPKVEDYPANQMYFPLLVRGSKGRGKQIKERFTLISRAMLVRMHRYFNSRQYSKNCAWPEEQKPAFLNTYGEPLKATAIQKFFSDALGRTDLSKGTPHLLRHGGAYSIMRSEHGNTLLDNLLIVQRCLGHAQISTTEIYTHIPAPALQRIEECQGVDSIRYRYEEAQQILERTFIPERKLPKARRIGVPQCPQ